MAFLLTIIKGNYMLAYQGKSLISIKVICERIQGKPIASSYKKKTRLVDGKLKKLRAYLTEKLATFHRDRLLPKSKTIFKRRHMTNSARNLRKV